METINRLYIIDSSKPFTGSIENSMSCQKEYGTPQYVDYMDKPTTFEEYKTLKNNPNLKIIEDSELDVLLAQHRASLCESWEPITEDEYYDLLECVPPKRWRNIDTGINVFAVGECYTMDLYTHCIYDKTLNKYFKALRPIGSTDIHLLNDYQGFINNNNSL